MTINKTKYLEKVLSILPAGSSIESEYLGSRERITIKCPEGHLRTTTCNDIVSRKGSICRICNPAKNVKKDTEDVRKKLAELGFILQSEYLGALKPITITNTECNHTYEVAQASSLWRAGRANLCPSCKPQYDFMEVLAINKHTLVSEYVDRKTNVQIINSNCGHEYTVTPGHYLYEGIGKECLICGTIKQRFFSSLVNHELLEPYKSVRTPIKLRNDVCNHEYQVTPNNLVYAGSGLICRVCNPSISKPEEEIKEFISSNYTGWIEYNDRSLIRPQELDIVLPELGLAFEINGEYWHRDKPTYHMDKTNMVEEMDFQLIHITDIQWNTQKDIIKSRILSILDKTRKIFARKCCVHRLNSMPKEFLATNHIQGVGAPSSINYGLYYADILVAVMTFKKNTLYGADYELVRYCSLLNTTVVGGAGKLLKAFERDFNNPKILSYAARDWSKGGLYSKLGFTKINTTVPGYHYFKNGKVYSRQTFQKAKLKKLFPNSYSDAKSEREILLEEGYYRYYDSGNLVFLKQS